tara:strand:- start:342 stop:548 length:207 start_codon:yes stop_codon:yes gene_type:complete
LNLYGDFLSPNGQIVSLSARQKNFFYPTNKNLTKYFALCPTEDKRFHPNFSDRINKEAETKAKAYKRI